MAESTPAAAAAMIERLPEEPQEDTRTREPGLLHARVAELEEAGVMGGAAALHVGWRGARVSDLQPTASRARQLSIA